MVPSLYQPISEDTFAEDTRSRRIGGHHSARQIYAHARAYPSHDRDNELRSTGLTGRHGSTHRSNHSHELSIGHVTRDSMVVNLVQSLNFPPSDDTDQDFEYPGILPPEQPTPRAVPDRDRKMDSETSSDCDLRVDEYFTADDEARSPSLPNDTNSPRRPTTPRTSTDASTPLASRQQHQSPHQVKVRQAAKPGKKNSKSSSIESTENTPSRDRKKTASSSSNNAQSLSPDRPHTASQRQEVQPIAPSILDRARPLPAEYHDFNDAAPMPNIPMNKRELPSPLYPPRMLGYESGSFPGSAPSSPRRPNYKQQHSSRNKVAALTGSDAMLPEDRKVQYQYGVTEQSHKKRGSDEQSLRSKMKPQITRSQQTLDPFPLPKEKSGFFKRVFGSSKSQSPYPEPAPQLPPLVTASNVTSGVQSPADIGNLRSDRQATKMLPLPPEPIGGDQEPPQILHKKSSFFRRRKKTVSEKEQRSTEDTPSATNASTNLNSPSVSSLHKVMQPFFSEDNTPAGSSPTPEFFDSREEQPRSAKISVHSQHRPSTGHRVQDVRKGSVPYLQTPSPTSSRQDTHRPFTSLQNDKASPTSLKDSGLSKSGNSFTSFTNETSGTEGKTNKNRKASTHSQKISSGGEEKRRPRTSHDASTRVDLPLRRKEVPGASVWSTNEGTTSPISPASPQKKTPAPLELSKRKEAELQDDDDGWVMKTPTRKNNNSRESNQQNRIWLKPTASDERLNAEQNVSTIYKTTDQVVLSETRESVDDVDGDNEATVIADVPIVQLDGEAHDITQMTTSEEQADPEEPQEADFEQARQLFGDQVDPMEQVKTMGLLGEARDIGERTRRAYMSFFDFAGLNILLAFRDLCARLTLKGETQQVDRVIASFSRRWCECNPNHGFKSKDVVHLICYSLLLLNTDLHVAELDQKMTRTQFVKNALPSIRGIIDSETDDKNATIRPNRTIGRAALSMRDTRSPSPAINEDARPSLEVRTDSRLSVRASPRPTSEVPSVASPSPSDSRPTDTSDLLLHNPFEGSMRAWETHIETVLRDFYASIRSQRIPLHGAPEMQLHEQPSSNSLAVTSPSIHRSGSIVSKTASENMRGRSTPDFRNPGSRWNSKPRSARAKFYQGSTLSSSRTTSRTSLEDSLWSPSASSTWSKSYFGRAHSAMSTDSLGSHMTRGDYGFQQSIGFANALSHAIIREEGTGFDDMEGDIVEFEDETLELAGAPWAKEGIVYHKHHLETTDKKSKDRNWNECFAVVERGWVRLFSFNSKSSIRAKNKALRGGGVVGGGNWTENAEALDSFMLRQTIANALPPPGYSKTRPHVFALSLPTGAVHLFQVGTPEIVKEFVSTANYWSARLSKEPLVGGVSNVEYGWGDGVVNMALLSPQITPSTDPSIRGSTATDSIPTGKGMPPPPPRSSIHSRTISQLSSRPSLQGSIRSSGDPSGAGSLRSRMPGDRIHLAEWTPPQQSMMASNLPEDEQLESLRRYVNDIEEELQRHNELRAPMLLAFSPRHPNANKAMANWERKSSYLLREIVKFRTYCDSLIAAANAKETIEAERKEREEELSAIRSKNDKTKAQDDDGDDADSLNLPEETVHALALAQSFKVDAV